MMRKLFSVITALMLLGALCVPVFAAPTATMTVTASEATVKPGDTVTFTVSVTQVKDATMGGFRFAFDEAVFEYVKGGSKSALKGFMAGVSTAANKIAGYFMNGKKTVEGELFSVTLKVRPGVTPGTYTVSGKPSISAGDQIACDVKDATVLVTDGKTNITETTQPAGTEPVAQPTDTPDVAVPQDPQTGSSEEIFATIPVQTAPTFAENGQEMPSEPAFPWWILVAVGVVAIGGAAFLIVEIKKTRR